VPRSRTRLGSIAVATGLFSAPLLAQGQQDDADAAAVRRVIEAVAEFSSARNLGAMDTLYAPEGGVHIIEGAGVNHGWQDYRDNHLGRELAEFRTFHLRHYAIEPVVRGDIAWTSFRYETMIETAENRIELEGRGTAVLENRAGRWVIVHQHTSGRRKQPGS